MYPILFYDCLRSLLRTYATGSSIIVEDAMEVTDYLRYPFIVLVIVLLTAINLRGLDVVGRVAIVLCFVSLAPFLVFCLVGLPHVHPSRWLAGEC